jgi:uncharacterized protein YqgC (DUF456 family)
MTAFPSSDPRAADAESAMIYIWATLLLISNVLAWGSTFFALPGNWLILIFSVVYQLVLPTDAHPRLSWSVIGLSLALAVLGEAWEFMASAAGAAKRGGTRRGAVLSIIGSLIGSLGGAIVAAPILPVIGPVVGALVGGALGAFAGAYFGERNRTHADRVNIGKGALMGRLFGTAGKLALGLILLALITIDSFTG